MKNRKQTEAEKTIQGSPAWQEILKTEKELGIQEDPLFFFTEKDADGHDINDLDE